MQPDRKAVILLLVTAALGCVPLSAGGTLTLSADGLTVYDSVNNITWLADANLPAANRFTLPLCTAAGATPCVNASGSMNYDAAAASQALQVNPGGQTVYDPVSNVTWLANANLAATNSLGLPACQSATSPVAP
jgi:hypothetical protein